MTASAVSRPDTAHARAPGNNDHGAAEEISDEETVDLRLTIPTSDIPPFFNCNFPIQDFLETKIPRQDSITLAPQAAYCFTSTKPPKGSVNHLLTAPIPSSEYLNSIEQHLKRASQDGKQSFKDARYKSVEVPLWAVHFWRRLAYLSKLQETWSVSKYWLTNITHGQIIRLRHQTGFVVVDPKKILERFIYLGSDELVYSFCDQRHPVPSSKLALLLSNEWLTDGIMDLFMHHIGTLVESSPDPCSSTLIGSTSFSRELRKVVKEGIDYKARRAAILSRYESIIKTEKKKRLLFPLFINGNHWIAAMIDFEKRVFAFSMRFFLA